MRPLLPLHNRHNNTATPYICVWIYTCLLIHLLMKNENLNNTKSCVVSRGCVSNRQISPFPSSSHRVPSSRVPFHHALPPPGEQPVQLNTAPIYICVYTRLLPILSLRIFDLINNKKLFRMFTCSLPGTEQVNN